MENVNMIKRGQKWKIYKQCSWEGKPSETKKSLTTEPKRKKTSQNPCRERKSRRGKPTNETSYSTSPVVFLGGVSNPTNSVYCRSRSLSSRPIHGNGKTISWCRSQSSKEDHTEDPSRWEAMEMRYLSDDRSSSESHDTSKRSRDPGKVFWQKVRVERVEVKNLLESTREQCGQVGSSRLTPYKVPALASSSSDTGDTEYIFRQCTSPSNNGTNQYKQEETESTRIQSDSSVLSSYIGTEMLGANWSFSLEPQEEPIKTMESSGISSIKPTVNTSSIVSGAPCKVCTSPKQLRVYHSETDQRIKSQQASRGQEGYGTRTGTKCASKKNEKYTPTKSSSVPWKFPENDPTSSAVSSLETRLEDMGKGSKESGNGTYQGQNSFSETVRLLQRLKQLCFVDSSDEDDETPIETTALEIKNTEVKNKDIDSRMNDQDKQECKPEDIQHRLVGQDNSNPNITQKDTVGIIEKKQTDPIIEFFPDAVDNTRHEEGSNALKETNVKHLSVVQTVLPNTTSELTIMPSSERTTHSVTAPPSTHVSKDVHQDMLLTQELVAFHGESQINTAIQCKPCKQEDVKIGDSSSDVQAKRYSPEIYSCPLVETTCPLVETKDRSGTASILYPDTTVSKPPPQNRNVQKSSSMSTSPLSTKNVEAYKTIALEILYQRKLDQDRRKMEEANEKPCSPSVPAGNEVIKKKQKKTINKDKRNDCNAVSLTRSYRRIKGEIEKHKQRMMKRINEINLKTLPPTAIKNKPPSDIYYRPGSRSTSLPPRTGSSQSHLFDPLLPTTIGNFSDIDITQKCETILPENENTIQISQNTVGNVSNPDNANALSTSSDKELTVNDNKQSDQLKLFKHILRSPSAKAAQAVCQFLNPTTSRSYAPEMDVNISVEEILRKYQEIFSQTSNTGYENGLYQESVSKRQESCTTSKHDLSVRNSPPREVQSDCYSPQDILVGGSRNLTASEYILSNGQCGNVTPAMSESEIKYKEAQHNNEQSQTGVDLESEERRTTIPGYKSSAELQSELIKLRRHKSPLQRKPRATLSNDSELKPNRSIDIMQRNIRPYEKILRTPPPSPSPSTKSGYTTKYVDPTTRKRLRMRHGNLRAPVGSKNRDDHHGSDTPNTVEANRTLSSPSWLRKNILSEKNLHRNKGPHQASSKTSPSSSVHSTSSKSLSPRRSETMGSVGSDTGGGHTSRKVLVKRPDWFRKTMILAEKSMQTEDRSCFASTQTTQSRNEKTTGTQVPGVFARRKNNKNVDKKNAIGIKSWNSATGTSSKSTEMAKDTGKQMMFNPLFVSPERKPKHDGARVTSSQPCTVVTDESSSKKKEHVNRGASSVKCSGTDKSKPSPQHSKIPLPIHQMKNRSRNTTYKEPFGPQTDNVIKDVTTKECRKNELQTGNSYVDSTRVTNIFKDETDDGYNCKVPYSSMTVSTEEDDPVKPLARLVLPGGEYAVVSLEVVDPSKGDAASQRQMKTKYNGEGLKSTEVNSKTEKRLGVHNVPTNDTFIDEISEKSEDISLRRSTVAKTCAMILRDATQSSDEQENSESQDSKESGMYGQSPHVNSNSVKDKSSFKSVTKHTRHTQDTYKCSELYTTSRKHIPEYIKHNDEEEISEQDELISSGCWRSISNEHTSDEYDEVDDNDASSSQSKNGTKLKEYISPLPVENKSKFLALDEANSEKDNTKYRHKNDSTSEDSKKTNMISTVDSRYDCERKKSHPRLLKGTPCPSYQRDDQSLIKTQNTIATCQQHTTRKRSDGPISQGSPSNNITNTPPLSRGKIKANRNIELDPSVSMDTSREPTKMLCPPTCLSNDITVANNVGKIKANRIIELDPSVSMDTSREPTKMLCPPTCPSNNITVANNVGDTTTISPIKNESPYNDQQRVATCYSETTDTYSANPICAVPPIERWFTHRTGPPPGYLQRNFRQNELMEPVHNVSSGDSGYAHKTTEFYTMEYAQNHELYSDAESQLLREVALSYPYRPAACNSDNYLYEDMMLKQRSCRQSKKFLHVKRFENTKKYLEMNDVPLAGMHRTSISTELKHRDFLPSKSISLPDHHQVPDFAQNEPQYFEVATPDECLIKENNDDSISQRDNPENVSNANSLSEINVSKCSRILVIDATSSIAPQEAIDTEQTNPGAKPRDPYQLIRLYLDAVENLMLSRKPLIFSRRPPTLIIYVDDPNISSENNAIGVFNARLLEKVSMEVNPPRITSSTSSTTEPTLLQDHEAQPKEDRTCFTEGGQTKNDDEVELHKEELESKDIKPSVSDTETIEEIAMDQSPPLVGLHPLWFLTAPLLFSGAAKETNLFKRSSSSSRVSIIPVDEKGSESMSKNTESSDHINNSQHTAPPCCFIQDSNEVVDLKIPNYEECRLTSASENKVCFEGMNKPDVLVEVLTQVKDVRDMTEEKELGAVHGISYGPRNKSNWESSGRENGNDSIICEPSESENKVFIVGEEAMEEKHGVSHRSTVPFLDQPINIESLNTETSESCFYNWDLNRDLPTGIPLETRYFERSFNMDPTHTTRLMTAHPVIKEMEDRSIQLSVVQDIPDQSMKECHDVGTKISDEDREQSDHIEQCERAIQAEPCQNVDATEMGIENQYKRERDGRVSPDGKRSQISHQLGNAIQFVLETCVNTVVNATKEAIKGQKRDTRHQTTLEASEKCVKEDIFLSPMVFADFVSTFRGCEDSTHEDTSSRTSGTENSSHSNIMGGSPTYIKDDKNFKRVSRGEEYKQGENIMKPIPKFNNVSSMVDSTFMSTSALNSVLVDLSETSDDESEDVYNSVYTLVSPPASSKSKPIVFTTPKNDVKDSSNYRVQNKTTEENHDTHVKLKIKSIPDCWTKFWTNSSAFMVPDVCSTSKQNPDNEIRQPISEKLKTSQKPHSETPAPLFINHDTPDVNGNKSDIDLNVKTSFQESNDIQKTTNLDTRYSLQSMAAAGSSQVQRDLVNLSIMDPVVQTNTKGYQVYHYFPHASNYGNLSNILSEDPKRLWKILTNIDSCSDFQKSYKAAAKSKSGRSDSKAVSFSVPSHELCNDQVMSSAMMGNRRQSACSDNPNTVRSTKTLCSNCDKVCTDSETCSELNIVEILNVDRKDFPMKNDPPPSCSSFVNPSRDEGIIGKSSKESTRKNIVFDTLCKRGDIEKNIDEERGLCISRNASRLDSKHMKHLKNDYLTDQRPQTSMDHILQQKLKSNGENLLNETTSCENGFGSYIPVSYSSDVSQPKEETDQSKKWTKKASHELKMNGGCVSSPLKLQVCAAMTVEKTLNENASMTSFPTGISNMENINKWSSQAGDWIKKLNQIQDEIQQTFTMRTSFCTGESTCAIMSNSHKENRTVGMSDAFDPIPTQDTEFKIHDTNNVNVPRTSADSSGLLPSELKDRVVFMHKDISKSSENCKEMNCSLNQSSITAFTFDPIASSSRERNEGPVSSSAKQEHIGITKYDKEECVSNSVRNTDFTKIDLSDENILMSTLVQSQGTRQGATTLKVSLPGPFDSDSQDTSDPSKHKVNKVNHYLSEMPSTSLKEPISGPFDSDGQDTSDPSKHKVNTVNHCLSEMPSTTLKGPPMGQFDSDGQDASDPSKHQVSTVNHCLSEIPSTSLKEPISGPFDSDGQDAPDPLKHQVSTVNHCLSELPSVEGSEVHKELCTKNLKTLHEELCTKSLKIQQSSDLNRNQLWASSQLNFKENAPLVRGKIDEENEESENMTERKDNKADLQQSVGEINPMSRHNYEQIIQLNTSMKQSNLDERFATVLHQLSRKRKLQSDGQAENEDHFYEPTSKCSVRSNPFAQYEQHVLSSSVEDKMSLEKDSDRTSLHDQQQKNLDEIEMNVQRKCCLKTKEYNQIEKLPGDLNTVDSISQAASSKVLYLQEHLFGKTSISEQAEQNVEKNCVTKENSKDLMKIKSQLSMDTNKCQENMTFEAECFATQSAGNKELIQHRERTVFSRVETCEHKQGFQKHITGDTDYVALQMQTETSGNHKNRNVVGFEKAEVLYKDTFGICPNGSLRNRQYCKEDDSMTQSFCHVNVSQLNSNQETQNSSIQSSCPQDCLNKLKESTNDNNAVTTTSDISSIKDGHRSKEPSILFSIHDRSSTGCQNDLQDNQSLSSETKSQCRQMKHLRNKHVVSSSSQTPIYKGDINMLMSSSISSQDIECDDISYGSSTQEITSKKEIIHETPQTLPNSVIGQINEASNAVISTHSEAICHAIVYDDHDNPQPKEKKSNIPTITNKHEDIYGTSSNNNDPEINDKQRVNFPMEIPVDIYTIPDKSVSKSGGRKEDLPTRTVVISGPVNNVLLPVQRHNQTEHELQQCAPLPVSRSHEDQRGRPGENQHNSWWRSAMKKVRTFHKPSEMRTHKN